MTEHGVLPGLWPIHGEGVLARQGDLVLLIHPAGGAFTDRLLDLLADAARARATGLHFTDLVSAEFDTDAAAADPADQQSPAVVAFGPAGPGTAVAVYGAGWADVTTARGTQRLTAGEPHGRLRCVLPSTLIKIRAGVQSVPGDGETDPYLRLADGVVRAVALLYAPAEVAAEAPDAGRRATPAAEASPAAAAAAPPAAVASPAAAAPEAAAEPYAAEPYAAEPPAAAAPDAAAPDAAAPDAPEPYAAESYAAEAPSDAAEAPGLAPVPDQRSQAPEPFAGDLPEPEPGYHATRIEHAPSGFPAADLYAHPPSDPYAPPPSDPYAPPAADPYAAAPADPYAAPAPADPYAAPADPYAAPPSPPMAGPADGAPRPDFISISLVPGQEGAAGGPGPLGFAGDVPQRDPLPLGAEPPEARDLGLVEMPSAQVEGVYCKNGHFNDPEARYCAVCGISMGQLTKIQQKGNRPPLGVLVLSDGSVCQLDADYVIGREPTLDSAVAEGRARPLRLMGASGVVSRIHARVELDGWQVYICDLNSANGTQVLQPGERNPVNLQPGVRTPLMAGAQIRLGGEYGLQYDSHRHR
ncbi:MAG TPA: FHA domain-containing protein [Streptosporangiaceae bacterium]|nr:FHA domain-containing protein [Streptosporangiaceae bacterium]